MGCGGGEGEGWDAMVVRRMLRGCAARRQAARADGKWPLKLIVMSATLETDTFCGYFGCGGPVQVRLVSRLR